MSYIGRNGYLSLSEMQTNARYIWDILSGNGWSLPAVSAMLGNMQTESTINPNIWENLDEGNMSGGYGLVQWTPASKYIQWADINAYDYTELETQLFRIRYEVDNGLQWISTEAYPMTFAAFTTSNSTPEALAQAFMYNYERPADLNQPSRSTQARYWFEYLGGSANSGGIVTPKKMSKLLLYWTATGR